MKGKVNCTCGWSWNKSDSSAKDMYICHECGRDNSNNMKNGGWLDNYGTQANYNDSKATASSDMVGDGFSNVGRNYSPAWGGQFEDGGEIPMAQNGEIVPDLIDPELVHIKYPQGKDLLYTNKKFMPKNRPNKKPLYVESKNDPRYKAYQDSLLIYNKGEKAKNILLDKNTTEKSWKNYLRKEDNYINRNNKTKTYLRTGEGASDQDQDNAINRLEKLNKKIYPSTGLANNDFNAKFNWNNIGGFINHHLGGAFGDGDPYGSVQLFPKPQQQVIVKPTTTKETTKPKSGYWTEKDIPTANWKKFIKQHPGAIGMDPNNLDKDGFHLPIYAETKRDKLQPIQNNLQPEGLIQSDIEFNADMSGLKPIARQPKYYDIQENINQPFGGSQTNYRTSDLNSITSPDDLGPGNTRNIIPHYQTGGSIPGSVGFTYARTKGIPSNGPYAKKTMASAQNGQEMQYYQNGLDFKPKSISRDGGWLNKYEQAQEGTNLPSVRNLINSTMNRKIQANKGKGKETNVTKKDNTKTVTPKEIKKLSGKQQNELAKKQSEEQARKDWVQGSMEEAYKSPLMSPGYFTPEGMAIGALQGAVKMPGHIAEGDGWGVVGDAAMMLPFAPKGIKAAGKLTKEGLREGVDMIHPVGKALRQIQQEGIASGLSAQEIKKLQLEKVGITSAQRKGYFPGVSEIATEYITPYSYDNAAARIKDIPRRIIQGEKNSKNLTDVSADFVLNHEAKNLVSKPRYDAWRMYSGMPQKNNTFRMAETTPLNHPSYSAEELNNLEKFSLNNESKLLNSLPQKNDLAHLYYRDSEDLAKALPDLKAELQKIQDIKNKGIDISPSDFTQTNVMGGYNRRYFDNKMEYNDIWDLDLKGTKVQKYFGKPFLSHGQLDYSFQPAEEELTKLIKRAEYLNKNINKYIKSPVEEFYLDPKHFNNKLNQLNPKDLTIKKKKQGGIIKDDMGQWKYPGQITEIGSNQITMQGVPYDVLGISDEGDTKLMKPGKDYKFKGKKVTEFPMAKNGKRQEQKGLQNLEDLTNFTNYNKPSNWLNKYN